MDAQTRPAIEKGQRVKISSSIGQGDRYHGREGVVESVDGHTSLNVRVVFSVGGSNWFSEGELQVIEP